VAAICDGEFPLISTSFTLTFLKNEKQRLTKIHAFFYLDRKYFNGSDLSQTAVKCIGRRSYLSIILNSETMVSNCSRYLGFGLMAAQ
jgi:hypothetical protein